MSPENWPITRNGCTNMEDLLFQAQVEFCRTMGNATRLQLLHTLRGGPQTVSELTAETGFIPSAVSR